MGQTGMTPLKQSWRLDWKHPIEEVNDYISNMKVAYDPETLAEEAEMINKDVTEEDFFVLL